jgi:hypothetical protein
MYTKTRDFDSIPTAGNLIEHYELGPRLYIAVTGAVNTVQFPLFPPFLVCNSVFCKQEIFSNTNRFPFNPGSF